MAERIDPFYPQANISPRRQAFDRAVIQGIERVVRFVAWHWLPLANLLSFVLAALPLLAPYLMHLGLTLPARAIYLGYSLVCHQVPWRSFHLFGHQLAVCQRDFAIYWSIFLAGLIFTLVRSRLKPLDWRLYLLLITPMALDGFTQLFGWRESTWELRTLTGGLFGAASVWLLFPYFERGMREVQATLMLHQATRTGQGGPTP